MITPCSKCHKRHGRDHGHRSSGGRPVKMAASKSAHLARALALMASLLGFATSSSIDVAAPLVESIVNIEGKSSLNIVARDVFAPDIAPGGRRIQAVDEDHDHEGEDGLDEYHGEEENGLNIFEEAHEEEQGEV